MSFPTILLSVARDLSVAWETRFKDFTFHKHFMSHLEKKYKVRLRECGSYLECMIVSYQRLLS